MSKAIRLLTICVIAAVLLAATAVWAAADAGDAADLPSSPEAEAVTDTDAETETEDSPMAPVDFPAVEPAGTVYTVSTSGAVLAGSYPSDTAVTTVDYTAEGADAGVQFDGGSRYCYGAQITGSDYGAVIGSAVNGYFGSSNGSIPLYDAKGAVSGIVWGGCRPTAVDCGVGFLMNGDVTGSILVEDGAGFTCRGSVILCTAGSGSFRFHNARLSSESGELLRMDPGAGDISVVYENGSYRGDHINGGDGSLTVEVGHGALLFGDMAASGGPVGVSVDAGAIWVVDECATLTSLCVEDGGTVYGELLEAGGGCLILFPSDQVLEPGTYEAEPVTEELPVGHGPALPAEEALQADEAELEEGIDDKLFPLVPGPAAATESVPEAEEVSEPEAAPEPEGASEAEEAVAENDDQDKRLFPLSPAATDAGQTQDEPAEAAAAEAEPEPAPEEEQPSDGDDVSPEEDIPISAVPEAEQSTMRRSLLLGIGLATPSALDATVGAVSPSVSFAARLAAQTTGQPPAASLLKTGAKTHSFLPQALDNRAIILYNPYCCSAA